MNQPTAVDKNKNDNDDNNNNNNNNNNKNNNMNVATTRTHHFVGCALLGSISRRMLSHQLPTYTILLQN